MSEPARPSALDGFLRLFADVRAGEGVTALLLALDVFLLLAAYYVIKPLRDGLVLSQYSAEVKSYLQLVNVVVLAAVVPAYGRLADRFPRPRLLGAVTLTFAALLVVFALLGGAGVPLGIPLFVYGSVFAVMVVAQFWSFASDLYGRDEGERLFPIVAFGASLGGVVGATFVGRLIAPAGVYLPMLLAALLLLVQLALTLAIDRRERRRREAHLAVGDTTASIAATGAFRRPRTLEEMERLAEQERRAYEARRRGEAIERYDAEPSGHGAFGLVARTPYLLLICLLVLLLNWVNTNGEYLLGRIVSQAAASAGARGDQAGAFISAFYADFYSVVNVAGLLVQLFLTSRIVRWFGVRRAVMVLPAIAFGSYALIGLLPLVGVVRWAKTAENSLDYSLNKTVRSMLFLPTTREQKYKAIQVSDSFSHRAGDVLHALTVFVAVGVGGLGVRPFAWLNLALVALWLGVAWALGRRYGRLVASGRPPLPRG